MKLSTKIKKYCGVWCCGGNSDIVMQKIVLMVDGKRTYQGQEFSTYDLKQADEYHRHLTKDEKCTLLPLNECPVCNGEEIIMHYTSTTYADWCNGTNERKQDMNTYKFEIGQKFTREGLFGGSFNCEVISRTKTSITVRETWIAEDSGKLCHHNEKHSTEMQDIGNGIQVERFATWEYRGEHGYQYCITDDQMYELLYQETEDFKDPFCFDDAFSVDECENDYGPSNPWDAPGMRVSDFITGVSPF